MAGPTRAEPGEKAKGAEKNSPAPLIYLHYSKLEGENRQELKYFIYRDTIELRGRVKVRGLDNKFCHSGRVPKWEENKGAGDENRHVRPRSGRREHRASYRSKNSIGLNRLKTL